MPVMAPYLIGLVTAPLVAKIVKPILRGTVKASVGLALEVKKAAAEAGEEFHGLKAEVAADKAGGPVGRAGEAAGRAVEAAGKAAEAEVSADMAAATGLARGVSGGKRAGQ